jgi:hypothetical protein
VLLWSGGLLTSQIDILPAQEGILVLRHAHAARGPRWIRVQLYGSGTVSFKIASLNEATSATW